MTEASKLENVIPTKTESYRYAESIFYVQFNGITIYVEDTDQEELYFCILSKVLNGIRLERIFSLDGKKNVLDHAATSSNAKAVYIVDKDFDDLLGKVTTIKHVIYLHHYSIENYLLETDAVIKLIIGQNPTLKSQKIKKEFDVQEFVQSAFESLRLLFCLFFIVQKHRLELSNTSMSIGRFVATSPQVQVKTAEVDKYKQQVATLLSKSGINVEDEIQTHALPFELGTKPPFKGTNICGKHLIWMLAQHCAQVYNFNKLDMSSATYRLAEHCKFVSLEFIRQEVTRLV